MPCNRFWQIRILNSVFINHIWGIYCHHIEHMLPKYCRSFSQISGNNFNFIIEMIQPHASSRHISTFLLNLQSGKMLSAGFCLQKNGYDTGSGTHIQYAFPFLYVCKPAEQHPVHAKAEFILMLDYFISISFQIIQTFSWP